MSLEPEKRTKLDDAILESLLRESYHGDPKEQYRISSVMNFLESEKDTPAKSKSSFSDPTLRYRLSKRSWLSMALAASLLLVAGLSFFYFTSSNAAYAAVLRSLDVAPKNRTYSIRMVHQRPIWGNREVTADLYLNDKDQIAVRHPGWSRFGELWIGGDSSNGWVVPRFGPAFVGGSEIVGGWLSKKDLPSPYLHVSTILKRMSSAYHLKMNKNTKFLDTASIEESHDPDSYQHIVGELRRVNKSLPSKIELWARLDTGIAQRLQLTWNRAETERGPLQWTFDLVDSAEFPNDWFTVEGHIAASRRIISIKSPDELDDAESVLP